MTVPVVLVFYHPDTREIFWKAIKEHLALYPSILNGAAETCVIPFDKEQDRLETESLVSLEAVEAKRFSYENILMESGHSELGWSNWFLVRRFPVLWSADVRLHSTSRIAANLNRQYTFAFQGNQLLTFSDIRKEDCELRNFVDTSSIRPAPQDGVPAPTIVELLNQALLFVAQANDLIRRGDRFYFSPSLLRTSENNTFSYIALKGEQTERTKIYMQKSEYKYHAVRLRSPILDKEAAINIVRKALGKFHSARNRYPERLVIHKTSRYTPPEIEGFEEALSELKIAYDLVSLTKAPLRLIRWGQYPVPRGAMYEFSDADAYLYTKGFVPDLQTYPGNHIPSPFWVQKARGDSSMKTICDEILMLTKLNWNTADFCCGVPITLSFARNVGEVFKEFADPDEYEPSRFFRFYM